MDGSSHSYHLALHWFAVLRIRREEIRAHWFLPYFIIATLRISSSVFFQMPPLREDGKIEGKISSVKCEEDFFLEQNKVLFILFCF